jgi:hypothetical protein
MNGMIKVWTLRTVLGIGMLSSLGGVWTSAAAQEAAAGAGIVTPDPAACQVEPRTIEEVTGLFASATPIPADENPVTVTVPVGRPADAGTAAEVTASVHEIFACINTGDFFRFSQFLTDEGLVASFPWVGESLAAGPAPAELTHPTGLPAEQWQTLVSVAGIARLADGRVGAMITYYDPSSADQGTQALYLVFTYQGGRWLVDQVIGFTS